MGKSVTCCFTGHRPSKLPWGLNEYDERCLAMKDELAMRLEGIYMAGYRHFICGMALGCDTYFAQAVLALRDERPEVSLEAAVPCRDQPSGWAEEQRQLYGQLLSKCDKVSILQEKYTPGCMMRRNRYMIDRSSLLLACYNGLPGGTMKSLLYARRQGLQTIVIDI